MPVESSTSSGTQTHRAPWLLHSIDTNALNFCSFAMCYQHQNASEPEDTSPASTGDERAILIALPSAMDSDLVSQARCVGQRYEQSLIKCGELGTCRLTYCSFRVASEYIPQLEWTKRRLLWCLQRHRPNLVSQGRPDPSSRLGRKYIFRLQEFAKA